MNTDFRSVGSRFMQSSLYRKVAQFSCAIEEGFILFMVEKKFPAGSFLSVYFQVHLASFL